MFRFLNHSFNTRRVTTHFPPSILDMISYILRILVPLSQGSRQFLMDKVIIKKSTARISVIYFTGLELKFYLAAGVQAGFRTFLHLKILFFTSHSQLPDGTVKGTSQEGCSDTKQH